MIAVHVLFLTVEVRRKPRWPWVAITKEPRGVGWWFCRPLEIERIRDTDT